MSGDFWSRRREAVAAEAEADIRAKEQAEHEKLEAERDALSDEEILAQYDLPDPDTLDSPDAVKDFLSHGLPQRLKTRALRRLWRLNPILANVDGLVDYGEDYTDAATVIEGMQTAYQVGKGMLAHLEAQAEKEAEQENEASTEPAEDVDAPKEEDLVLAEASDIGIEPEPTSLSVPTETDVDDFVEDAPAVPTMNRRMTFQFESAT